jgi:surface antigen
LQKTLKRKAVKKRLIRVGLVSANLFVLAGVLAFVITSAKQDEPALAAISQQGAAAVSPVDRLTAYDVAANVAEAVNLPEKTPIVNQAQSARVAVSVSTNEAGISAKPQVVSTALKSWRDINDYTVQPGENVQSIAQKFGVTSQSIRWSNGLSSDNATAGTNLVIPPVNGIVHTVVAGDTPEKLASTYRSNADKIIQYNDAEQNGLVAGQRIIIPDGQIVAVTRSYYSSFSPNYSSNGYDWGWCTWYAAAQSSAPSNWGNARTWAYYARLSGWKVASTPTAGAIFQTPAGWAGHVGIVEEVYDNGTMKISDMNGIRGFGKVGTAVVPISTYPNFISR